MTPRPIPWTRRAAAAGIVFAAGLASLTQAGCDPRAIVYFLQPNDPSIKPPCPSMKGKRVVVITHATSNALSDFHAVDEEMGKGLISILREKVKKIDVVDPSKIKAWADAHPDWTDPAEVGKQFEADFVIFLEVEHFQIQSPNSPGMLEGISKVHVLVTQFKDAKDSKGRTLVDNEKESKVVHDDYRDTTFPNRGPIPVDGQVSRQIFKRTFLELVVKEISWYFVDHAKGDNVQSVNFDK